MNEKNFIGDTYSGKKAIGNPTIVLNKVPPSGTRGPHSFRELSQLFDSKFSNRHFPQHPEMLYNAAQYLLTLGGKRIRPVMCLMGNELFDEINPDTFHVATAIELFHNFTLIHDDIMDKAPMRRGMQTVHIKYGEATALLSGDVMMVVAYEYLNKVNREFIHRILALFNTMAKQVCEGQQLDMEFAQRALQRSSDGPSGDKNNSVSFEDYVSMIRLKTSVLLGASLQAGALLGGAGTGNQQHLYEFGTNLGIAFQVQDDYLDAFGDPEKFGKKQGGDIMANKKTFLLIQALHSGTPSQVEELQQLMQTNDDNKIPRVLNIYRACNLGDWAKELKQSYMAQAMVHLEETAVLSARKKPLEELATYLLDREI
jgi:geranylgeranyl diphosphate synthase type II